MGDGRAVSAPESNVELEIRRTEASDRRSIIDLCRASLGWKPGDPNEAFFAWKHDENPFGPSPSWVAVAADGSVVGLRVFLRWRFRTPKGATFTGVRAVDTATHPDWQGKGIFTKLTLGALPDLFDDGIDVVFNTPNDKSRPGYLKMGWSEVGRVPVGIRLTSPLSLVKVAKARTAAELWSEPTDFGFDPLVAFDDDDEVSRLLERTRQRGIHTDRSGDYLRWRYSFDPLRYRVVPVGDSISDGVVVFRLRRRGPAVECAVCEVLVPSADARRRALGYIGRRSGADYLLRCVGYSGAADGFVPAPQLGPILTWKPVARTGVPQLSELDLALGDVELF